MKISRISVYQVDLPYVGGDYSWAKGQSVSVADSTVARVETDQGIEGWGETCPLGAVYLPAFAKGLRAGIDELAPHLIGQEATSVVALMDAAMTGQNYVKSAIDMACWDLLGKAAGLPVHALLGGRRNDAMAMYRAVPQGTAAEMKAAVIGFRAEGYRQYQLKVGGDPAEDIARIKTVVESLEPGEILLADGNRGWRRDEALQVAVGTQGLHYYFEQPCSRYEDCCAVAKRANQPLKIDESLQTLDDALRIAADSVADAVSIKVSKLGGLTKAKLVRDIFAGIGVPMTIEDTWGGEIVTAALAHLAASTAPEVLLNTTDLHNYNTVNLAKADLWTDQGRLYVGDSPGLGVEPDLDALGPAVAVYR